MGHSDDFEYSIQNNECIEIAGKYEWETFQEISFDIFSIKSRICNPVLDTLTDVTGAYGQQGVSLVLQGSDKFHPDF